MRRIIAARRKSSPFSNDANSSLKCNSQTYEVGRGSVTWSFAGPSIELGFNPQKLLFRDGAEVADPLVLSRLTISGRSPAMLMSQMLCPRRILALQECVESLRRRECFGLDSL